MTATGRQGISLQGWANSVSPPFNHERFDICSIEELGTIQATSATRSRKKRRCTDSAHGKALNMPWRLISNLYGDSNNYTMGRICCLSVDW